MEFAEYLGFRNGISHVMARHADSVRCQQMCVTGVVQLQTCFFRLPMISLEFKSVKGGWPGAG